MKTPEIKNPFKKIALVLSICAILLWSALGAGTSLAWFADTSTELNNIFQFAEFKLKVEHLDDGDWETVTSETKIFNEDDLFEPGYVQVQYLRVKNEGTVPFRFQTAVIINDCVFATNVYGDVLKLADYLKFGLSYFDSEQEMADALINREAASKLANDRLDAYSPDTRELGAGETSYLALIVRMPEEVGNEANYRGNIVPYVELGITVRADQIVD